MALLIDTEFEMNLDTPVGKDPDSHSPTLRRYHQTIWSKPLPSGRMFNLSVERTGSYLFHESTIGEFHLSSDAFGHTYRDWKSMASIIKAIPPDEIAQFYRTACTIGAYIVFPAKTINRKQNINMARGTNHKIRDRFDLTLECIRLHYLGEISPLSEILLRYADFFSLFGSFEGYVEFFLLQDLVTDHHLRVQFFLPFHGFTAPAVPQSVEQYLSYRNRLTDFIKARNRRISEISC